MRIHDISVPISKDTPVFPGDPPVEIMRVLQLEKGDLANVSRLSFGNHTGTHIDPPSHFILGGKTVDQLDLNVLYGSAYVVDLTAVERVITASDLARAKLPPRIERILCKTHNGSLWDQTGFQKGFVAFSQDAAEWLVARGARLVGIDYLSAEMFAAPEPRAHRVLLGAGVIIVEGLNLKDIAAGDYTLACLPLKIKNGDGAPARVILIEP